MYNLKNILKIIGGVLVVLIFIVFLVVFNKKNQDPGTDTVLGLPLEEQAERTGKDISEFTPKPTGAPSLEEIIDDSLEKEEDLIPEPVSAPTLEEMAEEKGVDVSEFTPEPTEAPPL